VIIDLPRFLAAERPYWEELHTWLDRAETEAGRRRSLEELRRFHYLYERTAADLARLTTFAAEPETRAYLESLVARAYASIHESARSSPTFSFARWFFHGFPQTFRRRWRAFQLSLVATLAGCLFGGAALLLDPEAREVLMPFEALKQSPAERVAQEEAAGRPTVAGSRGTFSAFLMTHNTRVAILTMALGMTFGVGTLVLLFYNGAILGAVAMDYAAAGHATFLAGWLLPHGSVEIPAILIAGQAGLVLGGALLGRGQGGTLGRRLRQASPDLATLVAGAAVLLVWAGLVESFLSQDHEPRLPYGLKIGFGLTELVLLGCFLGYSGRRRAGRDESHET
jgi:uncharacterized membrane protein SpoIIM required for sporulation